LNNALQTQKTSDDDFGIDSLNYLEESLYHEGLAEGISHGQVHGLIEGRELGAQKGWEIWEELGYYDGWAEFWLAFSGAEGRVRERLEGLRSAISKMPRANDSGRMVMNEGEQQEPEVEEADQDMDRHEGQEVSPATPSHEVDIPALLTSIRSKYRLACSSLKVRPRLTTASPAGVSL